MLPENFVFLAAALNLIGGSGYIVATLRGQAKPHRVTWVIWTIAAFIAFAAEISDGVGIAALMTFVTGFGPAVVVAVSFISPHASWRISRFDIICGGLALGGLGLWVLTHTSAFAMVFAIAAAFIASIPTLLKAYSYPETENSSAFWLGASCAGVTMLTLDHWNLSHSGFPVYVAVIDLVLASLISFKLGTLLSRGGQPRPVTAAVPGLPTRQERT